MPSLNMKQPRAAIYSWLLVIVLAALLVYPSLAYPIEEHAVDGGLYHVRRSVVFTAAQEAGWFYPRWVQALNIGLGSPLFSFYPPMSYFAMSGLHRLGLSHMLAWRVWVALAYLAAMTGAFALGLLLFKRADAALAGAVLYAFLPSLFHEIFGRGSPEGLVVCWYPWLLWSWLRLVDRPSGLGLACAALLWTMLCLTHTLTLLFLLPTAALFILYAGIERGVRRLWPVGLSLLHGALLGLFYLAPFVLERRYVQFENVAIQDPVQPALHPLTLAELVAQPELLDTGFGSVREWGPGLGWPHAVVLVGGLALIPVLWRRKRWAALALGGGSALVGLFVVWMQTAGATGLWQAWSFLEVVQFRWRLLVMISIAVLAIQGYLLGLAPARLRAALSAALIAITVGLALPTLYPAYYQRWASFTSLPPTVEEAQRFALAHVAPDLTGHFEFQPRARQAKYEPEEARRVAASPIANLPSGGHIWEDTRGDRLFRVELETPIAFEAALHVLRYPGWVGALDGQPVPLRPLKGLGYTLMDVPAGRHTVELRYMGTRTQRYSNLVSLAALAGLLPLLLWRGARARDAHDIHYLRPRWGVALGLAALVGFKLAWLDPHTAFLRRASTCERVHGAQVSTDVRFADRVRLCGYTVSPQVLRPGEMIRVTLYWQKLSTESVGADNFVHLLGSAVNPRIGIPVWGQLDLQRPADHPIHAWEQGKLYANEYHFPIERDTPPGAYHLEIGWYKPTSWERLEPEIVRPAQGLSVLNGALYVGGITVQ